MDKIARIRQEIERLKSKYRHNGLWTSSFQSDLAMAKIEAMNELLSFIDTLSEEPDKSLEEAAKEYVKDIPAFKDSCLMKAAFEDGWLCSKEQMLKDAVEGEAEELYNDGESQCIVSVGTYFKPGDEVYVIPKED